MIEKGISTGKCGKKREDENMIQLHKCRYNPQSYWKRYAVLQYEQNDTDPEPVLVGCRYFQTLGGAEAYKAKLGEVMADADRQEAQGSGGAAGTLN